MFEVETASVIRYVLDKTEGIQAYYNEIPQGAVIPSVYFPVPEITSRGDTFYSYALEYVWDLKFFGNDTPEAYRLGFDLLSAIKEDRNLIPLIDTEGDFDGTLLRVKDPELKKDEKESGIAYLKISWDSRRPYNRDEAEKMVRKQFTMHNA